MKSIMGAALLACLSTAVSADTLPTRELVMDYVSATGIKDNIDRNALAIGKSLTAKGLPGGEENVSQLLASTVGWAAVKDDFISLIQRTYTTEELKAMIAFARSPAVKGLPAKSEQFMAQANAMMWRQARLLDNIVPAELNRSSVTVGKDEGASERTGITYAVPPNPIYPRESRAKGEEGVVALMVLVGPKGDAEAVGVRKSSGFPRLDEAALAALAQAKFRPYVENGVAIRAYSRASLTFQLSDDEKSQAEMPFRSDRLALPW